MTALAESSLPFDLQQDQIDCCMRIWQVELDGEEPALVLASYQSIKKLMRIAEAVRLGKEAKELMVRIKS